MASQSPNRPRIVYWTNVPTPNLAGRFDAVARRGNIDFEAWFNSQGESDRSWEIDESRWSFQHRYLPSMTAGGRTLALPAPLFGQQPPNLLISLYAEPTFVAGWAHAWARGLRTAFWCPMTFDGSVPRRAWKDRAKRMMFSRVDATLGGGEESRAYAMRYGVPADRAFVLPRVIDSAHYAEGRAKALPERATLRQSLGLKGVTFLYAGRLGSKNGIDTLLAAFAEVQRRAGGEVSLLIVGDGPEDAKIRARCADLSIRNVELPGFVHATEMPRYYALADALVFPTLGDTYGLVVDEAMACSLPIVTTSSAGEIRDRVHEGVNGFLVPPQDATAMAAAMLKLAESAELRRTIGDASLRMMQGRSPDTWAENFETIVDRVLTMPRRNNKPSPEIADAIASTVVDAKEKLGAMERRMAGLRALQHAMAEREATHRVQEAADLAEFGPTDDKQRAA